MERSKVEDIVKKVVAENLGAPMDKIQGPSNIQEDLGADSLDVVELVMALEEEFEMEITDEEAEALMTVDQIVDFISEQLED